MLVKEIVVLMKLVLIIVGSEYLVLVDADGHIVLLTIVAVGVIIIVRNLVTTHVGRVRVGVVEKEKKIPQLMWDL